MADSVLTEASSSRKKALEYSDYVRYNAGDAKSTQEEAAMQDDDEQRFGKLIQGQFKFLSAQIEKGFKENDKSFNELGQRMDKLEGRMSTLEGEMKGVKRIVNLHSVEIMGLKAS